MTRGRKLTGQHGTYDFCCETYPRNDKESKLYTQLAMCYDQSERKQGFFLLIHHKNYLWLRQISRELNTMRAESKPIGKLLAYQERFKAKRSADSQDYEYFVLLRLVIPCSYTVSN